MPMTTPKLLLPIMAAITSACASVPPVNADGSSEARLGEMVNLGGPKVTVLRVLEDSRCPVEVDCVWAGRIKVSVKIELGSKTTEGELASDQPLPVADGLLTLVSATPAKSSQRTIAPGDYRFALKFSGGL